MQNNILSKFWKQYCIQCVQIFPVNEAMIRSRAEHNEGILGTLEELSMHMLHIEKLEHFDKLCKKLKILLLQNNIVSKIGTRV